MTGDVMTSSGPHVHSIFTVGPICRDLSAAAVLTPCTLAMTNRMYVMIFFLFFFFSGGRAGAEQEADNHRLPAEEV